jgi:beta-1,2-mannobiose phosphorylase / 1,2-beta-oligomannan phosphorylase
VPQEEYEFYGRVPRIVFPSGALIKGTEVHLYYGAADTTSCMATFKKKELLEQLVFTAKRQLTRFEGNPIISPTAEHAWESQCVFNPAAIYEDGKVHILYRAMSQDNTSVIGYASAKDGLHIDEQLSEPIYTPRVDFESKKVPNGNSGCEDPRVTKIGDTIYMCYTAYNGIDNPRVALTSIAAKDFDKHQWNWSQPILISPPGMDDKDAALFPKKIGGKYMFLHRLGSEIWIDSVDNLDFRDNKFLKGKILMSPRDTAWDSKRIGISAPPIETSYGWLLLYHGISKRTGHYNVRAALLDKKDPSKILYRTHDPLLEPKMQYEREGIVNNVVFPCGAAVIKHTLFVYYGGADKVVAVATIDIDFLIEGLVREAKSREF